MTSGRLPEQTRAAALYAVRAGRHAGRSRAKHVRADRRRRLATADCSSTAVNEALDKRGNGRRDDSPGSGGWRRPAGPRPFAGLGIQLAQALDYAHHQGVLHRDVKPANVLLSADGSPKLADFNISFCSQLDGASPAAYFGGSLAYMSPEQIEACNPAHDRQPQDLDGRSDLYALAVVLWELLYGERPFVDDDMASGWTAMLTAMAQRRHREEPRCARRARAIRCPCAWSTCCERLSPESGQSASPTARGWPAS